MGENYFQESDLRILVKHIFRNLVKIYMLVLCQEYMLFFSFAIEQSAKAPRVYAPRAPLLLWAEEVEPWLTTQWQTEKQYILLAEDGHVFLTCLQLVGTWVQNIFRNLVPDFRHVPDFLHVPSAVNFQFESQFEFPDPAEHYGSRLSNSLKCMVVGPPSESTASPPPPTPSDNRLTTRRNLVPYLDANQNPVPDFGIRIWYQILVVR